MRIVTAKCQKIGKNSIYYVPIFWDLRVYIHKNFNTSFVRYETQKEENQREESRMQEERRRLEKERNKMEAKEAELMEAANMVQERSREMDEIFSVNTKDDKKLRGLSS